MISAFAAHAAPKRVVSMNLCTDQIAMMLAAPGQLISVSDLAQDPRMSPMSSQAAAFPINYGRAEEIYLLRPDLVLAGEFASGPTVAMLRRLGLRVEVLPPAETIEAIRHEIKHVGALMGREVAARALLDQFDQELSRVTASRTRGRAALYYANGITSGGNTLAGTILRHAGFDNVADELGIRRTGTLPMELLVMSQPDYLITGAKWPGQSRSEAILDHPALSRIAPNTSHVTDRDWICGTPYILRAIEGLNP
ncbi:ABC transporter substrate-binding protein [Paracoccus sp. Z330]|uniref:ABC transporter substrate-binding protein n=1 Tax=Paracoccus onchidii TaxID=3017813 RepID=A0ABT4Z9L3_9RHOB|nr:ABC transporter substrate-binding protein [Paracoccus onchidii]MDB6176034.1 ABC transporter substrate-binding protein [Paracoccus onchidii]